MPWVKLDDAYFSNGKARGFGGKLRLLHMAGACWSAANLSDGTIPKRVVPLLIVQAEVPKSTVARLVAANLWHDQGDHYLIHDWHEYIKSKDQVLSERAAAAERQAKSRAKSHRDSSRDSQRESREMSHLPRPDPSLNDLHPPTTESRLGPDEGGVEDRTGAVIEVMLTTERAQANGHVRNQTTWDTKVRTRLFADHGTEARRLATRYPDAPPAVIAGYLRGETTSLGYYTPKD